MLRIDHVLDPQPKALSQGQKQRTALARGLVGRPGVVLLDDPLRNVDAKIRYEMRFELPRVLRRYESTVVYVTQDYKTTTLRMVAGLETVTDGEIRVGDRVVNALSPSQRNVAMAFETYALYPPLRVRENIAFGLHRDRVASAEIDRRNARDRGSRPPFRAAHSRLGLARALIRNAAVYLLDEPMSQLEPQLRALLRARIKDYLIAHKMTTVVVTHDQTEAIALADRIAVMEKGVLQQFATPHDLQERPANLFVASFIGEPPMNLFPAVAGEGKIAVLK